MHRSIVRVLGALTLAAALGGCSHTWFQLSVSPNELSHIENTRGRLAASARADLGTLSTVVDLQGRRGAEALIAGMTMQSTAADPQYDRLARTLYLGIMGDAEDPFSALDQDVNMMAARVGQRVAVGGLQSFGLGGIAEMVGAVGDDDGQRLQEMQGSLARARLETCQGGDVIVSYDAGILGHIHSDIADNDRHYQGWRQRVRAIHLVRFPCAGGRHALMVLTRNNGESGLRGIGWHVVTDAQWQAMRPRFRETFDLAEDP